MFAILQKQYKSYILSAFGASMTFLALSILIQNKEISMFYSFLVGIATYVILYVLITKEQLNLQINIENRFFLYAFFLLLTISTLILLITPRQEFVIYNEPIGSIFKNFNTLTILQTIASYSIIFFVPGISIHKILCKLIHFTTFEKIGIWIIFSFIFSSVTTLVLLFFDLFSIESYMIVVWSVAVYAILKDVRSTFKGKITFKFNYVDVLIVITVVTIILIPYYMLFNENLFSGITSGDISRYSIYSNGIANLNEMARVPYVWWSIPYWLISSFVEIPMLYPLVFSSFLVIVLPAGVHFFIRTIFPPKKYHLQLTILFTFLGLGATAVYPFYVFITSPSIFFDYLSNSNNLEILDIFFNHTGAPGLTQQLIQPNPSILDIAILTYITALFYNQLLDGNNTKKLIIISILFTSSIFIHSFNSAFAFIFIMMFFSLIKRKYAVISFKIVIFSIMSGIVFEIISGFFLVGKIPDVYSQKFINYTVIGGIVYVLIFYLRYNHTFENKLNNIKKIMQNSQRLRNITKTKTQNHLLFYLGVLMFTISTLSFIITSNDGFSKVWATRNTAIPLSLLLLKNYGPFLIFVFSAFAILHKTSTKSAQFIGIFIMSCTLILGLSLIFPNILASSIIYTRYSSFIAIPVVGLGIYALLTYMEKKRGRMIQTILLGSIITILIFASVSDAYVRERYVATGAIQSTLDQDIEAINWLNNNSKQKERVIVFDKVSQTYVSDLGKNLVIIPFVLQYTNSTYSQSWIHHILQDTSADDVKLYILTKMNVSYVFIRNSPQSFEDVEKGSFYIPESFPIVFEKNSTNHFGKTIIYKIPEYTVISGAPNVLIKPTKCMDENFNYIFNQLVSTGYQFDIIDDLDFASDTLDLQDRKIFILFNASCYNQTLDEIINKIPKEAIMYSVDENTHVVQNSPNIITNTPIKQIISSLVSSNNSDVYTNSIKEYNFSEGILKNIVPSYQSTKLDEKLANQGLFRSDLKLTGDVEIFSESPLPDAENNSLTKEYHILLKNSTVVIFHNSAVDVSKIGVKKISSEENDNYSQVFFIKNPRLKLDGELIGKGKVIIPSLNKYSSQFEDISLDGKFTIHIKYNSGLIFTKIIPN